MGKGDKKKKPKLPQLNVKPPKARGQGPRDAAGRFREEDPRKPVLSARARHRGLKDTREVMLQQTAPHLGDDVGRCIEELASDEASELWKVWTAFCSSRWNYRRRILGQSGFPKGMNLQMMPERFETDQSHTVDLRSEEERDQDAKDRYQDWNEWVASISLEYAGLIHATENGHVQVWANTAPTAQGHRIVSAIRALKEVVG